GGTIAATSLLVLTLNAPVNAGSNALGFGFTGIIGTSISGSIDFAAATSATAAGAISFLNKAGAVTLNGNLTAGDVSIVSSGVTTFNGAAAGGTGATFIAGDLTARGTTTFFGAAATIAGSLNVIAPATVNLASNRVNTVGGIIFNGGAVSTAGTGSVLLQGN